MDSIVRIELLDFEKQRREEVIAAAERRRGLIGGEDVIRKQYNTEKMINGCARATIRQLGRCPYVSANYQHWVEDREMWMYFFRTLEGFNWPMPQMLGVPYSSAVLGELFRESSEEESDDLLQKHRGLTFSIAMNEIDNLVNSAASDPRRQLEHLRYAVEEAIYTEVPGAGPFMLPMTMDDRCRSVMKTSMAVLSGIIGGVLDSNDDITIKIRNLDRYLGRHANGDNDEAAAWEKILPIGARLEVIREAVNRLWFTLDELIAVESYLATWC